MASQGSSENKRATNWSDCEVNALLNLWQENYEDLRRAKRNKHIYEAMQRSLEDLGVFRTSDQITTKLSNFMQAYRKKKSESASTSTSPSPWKWYDAINSIISRRPCEDDSREADSIANPEESTSQPSSISSNHLNDQVFISETDADIDVEDYKEVRRDEEQQLLLESAIGRSTTIGALCRDKGQTVEPGPSRNSTQTRKRRVLAQSSPAGRFSPLETPVENSEKTYSAKVEQAILSLIQTLDKRMEEDLALKRRMVACMENTLGQVYPSFSVPPNNFVNSTQFPSTPYPFFHGSQQSDLVPPSPRSKKGRTVSK